VGLKRERGGLSIRERGREGELGERETNKGVREMMREIEGCGVIEREAGNKIGD